MTYRLLFLVSLLFSMTLHAATEVIPLNFRMAQDMLPIAESVVGDQGKVNAYGNQLIVNAPDAVIAELRQVLSQLDSEPKRLLISVDTQNTALSNQSGYRVDGSVVIGDTEVRAGRGETGGRDQLRIIRRNTSSQGDGIQQVQTTEGYPALIQVGQSVPLTTSATDEYGRLYQQSQYRDVTRGFYATATVHGDRVQISISSQQDRISTSRADVVDIQETDTRVSGRLGEWISLGGIDQSASSSQSGTLRRHSTQGHQDFSLRLKVDLLQ